MEEEKRRTVADERESVVGRKFRSVESVVVVEDYLFRDFMERKRNEEGYHDVVFLLKNQAQVRANRALLAIGSSYFHALLSGHYAEQQTISVPFADSILFEVMLHYLADGLLVTSKEYGHEFWVMLAEMAEYYSLPTLLSICEQQLSSRVTEASCQELLVVALEMGMQALAKCCAEQIIRNMINQEKEEASEVFPEMRSHALSQQR